MAYNLEDKEYFGLILDTDAEQDLWDSSAPKTPRSELDDVKKELTNTKDQLTKALSTLAQMGKRLMDLEKKANGEKLVAVDK